MQRIIKKDDGPITFRDIPGWFNEEHVKFFDRIIESREIKTIIEVGTFLGRSTAFFASKGCRVHCIDPFKAWPEGIENGAVAPNESFLMDFRENMNDLGIADQVTFMPVSSNTADYVMSRQIIDDMVYIDGEHTYEAVKHDISLYLKRAKKIICGDDYDHNWPGVMKAVDELLPDRLVEGNIWYYDIKG